MKIYTYRSGHKTLKKVLSITLSLLVLVQMTPAAFVVNTVSAANNAVVPSGLQDGNNQIDLCHDNNGASDYSLVQGKVSAIIGETNAGHPPDANHTGDIIPPFHYDLDGDSIEDAGSPYLGRNWTNGGEAIFKANCIIPVPTPTGPTTGGIQVKKVVINDNGGTTATSSFSFKLDNGSAIFFEADGQNDLVVATGTHNIVEVAAAGYTTTYNGCSNINVVAGATTTCVITNDDNAPAGPTTGVLVVEKVVINDNGGSTATSSFSFKIDGVGSSTFFSSNGRAVVTGVAVGSHSVVEDPVNGYTTTYSGDCAPTGIVNIQAGATTSCVIINNDNVPPGPTTGTVIVHKVVINDDGGNTATSSFQFLINGGSLTNFDADGANDLTLSAGSYTITEATTSGYTVSYTNCSNIQIVAGQQATTCVVTNNDIAQPVIPTTGTLVVTKTVVNDNNGTAVSSDFTLNVTGTNPSLSSFAGNASGTVVTLGAGAYSVDENSFSGYNQTSNTCSGSIVAGATTTCEIINNDIALSPQPVLGCMDVNANNYNSNATQDDGSCTYNSTSSGGSSRRSGGGGIVLGINNDEPQGQVLGATFTPGLPATGNGPINTSSTNTLAVLFAGLMVLGGLNMASFKALKLEFKSK